ncbi:deleted in malignant brain tumors 1 protein-like isoform X2 [Pomacea canaliculata]|uniref:deleted in malignant brain tumors 1 protein-like isoform X2 n=1 Tax=Pomacea canaliculata TaxID=400727 RepID=UPI000D73421C|nr:deleted in malignant brain tumors 1 protein-like isoform X2 [Pomacea canaliculata]
MMYRAVSVYWISVLLVPSVAQQMSARIVNGTADAGRLEILYDGTWNTVCGYKFGQTEALVACRMLGFNSTTAVAVGSVKYGAGSGSILFDDLQCVGNETSLAQCQHSGLYRHNCQQSRDVGVMCNNISAQQMSARVVNGTADAGRLEILYDGTWGTVCGFVFGQREALVACRMLGFNSTTPVAVGSVKYGVGSGPILFDELRCVGNETSLAQCKHWGFYRHECTHWEDVGVMCNITTPMTARLHGGTSKAGRLEISVNGQWTTVCGDEFGQSEVEVALRMLGLNSTGQRAVKSLFYDGSRFQFWNMKCQGMETNLQQCEIGQLNKSICLDVGFICDFKSLRLTGPRRTYSNMGRVEVEIGSKQSGTVCVNNEKTAAVICRQLNLTPNYAALIDGLLFGQDTRPLLQATFACEGTESSLDECGRNNTVKGCYSNDVGVYCSTYKRLLIVSRDERYPFIEGANKALRCVTPRTYERDGEYTWVDAAGGRRSSDLLIFDNLTKEYNGRQVWCSTRYRERDSDSDIIWSDNHVLKVYYKPLITITWTNNTGEQQPLSSLSELKPGHNVTLWCEADSNPRPSSITWSGRVNSTTGELRIIAADHVTHSGVYTCTVVTETVDDDDRLPLTSSYRLTLSVQGLHLLSLFCFVLFCFVQYLMQTLSSIILSLQ